MNNIKNLFLLSTLALLVFAASEANACMKPNIEPAQPVFPSFVGGSPNAVIARPLKLKYFEDFGSRYWRAQYEVVAWNDGLEIYRMPQKIVVEWSCDQTDVWRADPCGDLV